MIAMKKWNKGAALLLAGCLLLSLCACGDKTGGGETQLPEPHVPQPAPAPSDTTATTPPDASTPEGNQPSGTEAEPPAQPDDSDAVSVLSLQKQSGGLYDWEDDGLLVRSEYSGVMLWNEDTAEYPQLAEVLEQTARMAKRTMEEEFDNFCVSVREDLPWSSEEMLPWISTLDIQVRRADSVSVSLLSDSYSDYGWIEDFRGMHGTTYDTQTGQVLALDDVVEVNNELAQAVLKELNSHMWAGDFYADDTVEAYFANTPHEDISWTLDYNGVTFYFADGELAEAGNGRQTATVSFAEYPQLFNEKYMAVPEAYIVELPMDSSFFTDLDGNGDLEELNVTGWYNSDVGLYGSFGIYTDTDGHYHYEECYADGFCPYYVKTAEGRHYLYLFCEHKEGAFPTFTLKVYEVSDGELTFVGEKNAGPGYIPADLHLVPTDPEALYLDDFDTLAQNMMLFAVGADGIPQLLEEVEPVFEAEGFVEYGCYDEMLEDTIWWSYVDVDPQSGESNWLSSEDVVLTFLADKTGSIQRGGETHSFTWSCLEDGSVCITLENGVNYYLTIYEDGIEDSGMYWMLLTLEERLVWLY